MRTRYNPNAKQILANCQFVIKSLPYIIAQPTVVEVGIGKGNGIINSAKNNSDKLFIGIEKNITILAIAIKKIVLAKIKNILLIHGDAKNITSFFSGLVNEVNIFFPDPWPKNKTIQRRLTSLDFLKLYRQILIKSGSLKLKTDSELLFNFSLNNLKIMGWKIINTNFDLHKNFDPSVATEYEKRFINRNQPIYYLEAINLPSMPTLFITNKKAETVKVAREILKLINPDKPLLLVGDIGTGKTTLVQFIARELGIKETVNSPTFNIMKIYNSLVHIDGYRISGSIAEWEEYFENKYLIIEWANNLSLHFNHFLKIKLFVVGKQHVFKVSEEK